MIKKFAACVLSLAMFFVIFATNDLELKAEVNNLFEITYETPTSIDMEQPLSPFEIYGENLSVYDDSIVVGYGVSPEGYEGKDLVAAVAWLYDRKGEELQKGQILFTVGGVDYVWHPGKLPDPTKEYYLLLEIPINGLGEEVNTVNFIMNGTSMEAEELGDNYFYAVFEVGTIDPSGNIIPPAPKYDVTFITNGGTPEPSIQNVEENTCASKPDTDPVKDGQVFTGWYSDEACTTAFDFSTPISVNTNIYAGYKPVERVVSFNTNGGVPESFTVTVNNGDFVSKPQDPTREGYAFGGWCSDESCTAPFDFETTTIVSDIPVYAKWNQLIGEKTVEKVGKTESVDIPKDAVTLSHEEEEALVAGNKVKIVVQIDDGQPEEAAKNALTEIAKSKSCEDIRFIDISLYSQIEGLSEKRTITETASEIAITVKIPDGMDYEHYFVVRYHDGEATELRSETNLENRTITFWTGKFSDYGIGGYGNRPSPEPNPTPAPPEPNPESDPEPENNPTGFSAPQTGDNNMGMIWGLVLSMGLAVTAISVLKKKR